MSRATSPWPPSWAMVIGVAGDAATAGAGTTAASATRPVAITSHRSGSGWVPKSAVPEVEAARRCVRCCPCSRAAPRCGRAGAWQCGTSCADGMQRVVGPRISQDSSRSRSGSPRRPWRPTGTWPRPRRSTPSSTVLSRTPTDPRPVRQLRTLKWGLVPSWAKTPEGGARMINARAETVHEKPSFRQRLRHPALHPARRRLLRVGHRRRGAGAGGRGEEEAAAQAAVLRAPRRRLGLRDGRAVRVLAGQDPARRPSAGLVGDLLGDHHRGGDGPAGRGPGRRARARWPTSTPGCR